MKIFDLFLKLEQEDFCLAYLDYFSDSSTDALIAIQDARTNTRKKIRKKISFLVTECFQNIVRHAAETTLEFDKFFAVRSSGIEHSIIATNPIQKKFQSELANSIDHLATLSPEELRAAYLNALDSNSFSAKGGAGLGLIEMARKSKKTPVYSFSPINDKIVEFRLELSLDEEENIEKNDKIISGDQLIAILKENSTLLLQKSDFSHDTVLSLFELLENSLNQIGKSAYDTKKLYLLIEMLQNMSNHAAETEGKKNGIFSLRKTNEGKLLFQTGNLVSNEVVPKTKAYLDSIISLDADELKKRYKHELRKESDTGIGLLEISKLTNQNMSYEIDQVDAKHSFLAINAHI